MGWSVGYAARAYYDSLPEGAEQLTEEEIAGPAYIYDSIRRSGASCDDGARITDALELLKSGAVPLSAYPYDTDLCRRPGPEISSRANGFRISDWLVVDTGRLDQVKGELASGHPVVIGMRTNRAFLQLRGKRVWRAGHPDEGDGHHAVTVVGYSERGRYFLVMNSWGRGWGERGFGRISYDAFGKHVKYGFAMRVAGGCCFPD